MQEKIEEIKKQAEEKIKEIKNSQELQDFKVKMLGKKSELSSLLKTLGSLTPKERPKVGALVNEARKSIEEKISIAEDAIMENMDLDPEGLLIAQKLLLFYNTGKNHR